MSVQTAPIDRAKLWEGSKKPSPLPQLRPYPNALRPISGGGGPQTEEGKAISSRNSTTHGLTARRVVLPGEDQSEFDTLLFGLTEDLDPQGQLEIQLTGEIAASFWRLARARDHEARILESTRGLYDPDRGAAQLALVMRYSGSIEREMHRTIARLELCQNQRRKLAATQFVSQVAEKEAPECAPVQAADPVTVPEFVSQPEENKPEPAPLVMAAGCSIPYVAADDLTELSEPSDNTDVNDAEFWAEMAAIDQEIASLAAGFGDRYHGGKKNRKRR